MRKFCIESHRTGLNTIAHEPRSEIHHTEDSPKPSAATIYDASRVRSAIRGVSFARL